FAGGAAGALLVSQEFGGTGSSRKHGITKVRDAANVTQFTRGILLTASPRRLDVFSLRGNGLVGKDICGWIEGRGHRSLLSDQTRPQRASMLGPNDGRQRLSTSRSDQLFAGPVVIASWRDCRRYNGSTCFGGAVCFARSG
ncbi:unnamed protein product, partial [Scytosiphon promiscuus]